MLSARPSDKNWNNHILFAKQLSSNTKGFGTTSDTRGGGGGLAPLLSHNSLDV